jgi:murein DD-endopeptidase MepM/ murein hydrolase activator NlpD
VASELLAARPRPEWVAAVGELAAPDATLEWPVPEGWFVRGYGSGEGGYHRAVDIAAEVGSEVVAVGPGIVGYVGNQIKGYGNIVLLIHPGGLVSLYAHNSKNLVQAGQAVHRGERIAEVGSTGISRGPHVHFEMLFEGENCDPAPLFRPFVRHRSGEASVLRQAAWKAGTRRPRAVACGRRLRHPNHSEGHSGEAGPE